MRNIVEKLVPADVLLYLGIYIETWAHIELRLWQIVRSVHQLKPHPIAITKADLDVKNNTRKLVAEFRGCKARLPPTLCIQIEVLASRVTAGLRNRNLAAHGAAYLDERHQELRVAHYYPEGRRADTQWFEVDGSVRIPQIRSEVSSANKLLLDLIALATQIEDHLNAEPS